MVVSPELALVDPDLRRQAIAELARSVPRYVVARAVAATPVWTPPETAARSRVPALVVGALAYLVVTVAQALVFGALLLLGVAVLVLAANLL